MTTLEPQPRGSHRGANGYPDNTHHWQKGDLVIHRFDEKKAHMLMRVIGYDDKTGECMTKYAFPDIDAYGRQRDRHTANRLRTTVWENDIKHLLDPAEFGIKVEDWK